MTMLVGIDPDGHGRAVLHMAGVLARAADDDLLLCAVVPSPWPPSPARVDAEYRAELQRIAADALEQARRRLPSDVAAELLIQQARSAPAGLLQVGAERDVSLIMAGSARHGGIGHVALGSVSARLLHSSPIPVAIAPRGFRARPDARVSRVTAAFGASDAADDLVVAAAGVAARAGASLRLATFAVRPRPPYTAGVGREADEAMLADWTRDIEAAAQAALAEVRALPAVPHALATEIGRGETWEEAIEDIDWGDGDVLVVGSSSIGPVARVFLGSRATKIVRHSPVPVAVVPRGAVADLAELAEESP